MKKQWISVKCGLSRDPKHRQAMGESVWLFLHMLDMADWESGKVMEWKDEGEADEMGMPVRTLREHRRKLEELDYISCAQKQYGQEITIHNWTSPREYSGTVSNKKQGGKEASPSGGQGYTQGYTQGNSKDVTPTSDSNNKDQNESEITTETTPKRVKKEKKMDVLGFMEFSEKLKAENGIDKVEELLCEIERGLHVNLARSLNNQAVAKRILKDGRPFGKWLTWCISEEWRAAHLYQYADLEKVWRDYPQGFVENEPANSIPEHLLAY